MDADLLLPIPECPVTRAPVTAGGHEMTSWAEVTVDQRMRRQEGLRLAPRLEPLHLSLSSPSGSVRILSPIVQVPTCPMPDVGQNGTLSDAVAAQPVGDKASRLVPQPLQQTLEESLGGGSVPSILHQDVQHDPVLIRRAPQIVQYAPDPDEHLVEVPLSLQAGVVVGAISWRSRPRIFCTSVGCSRGSPLCRAQRGSARRRAG